MKADKSIMSSVVSNSTPPAVPMVSILANVESVAAAYTKVSIFDAKTFHCVGSNFLVNWKPPVYVAASKSRVSSPVPPLIAIPPGAAE